MDQRLSFVTLAVQDLQASRRFYVDGLGWEAALDVGGEVLMFQVADKVVLSLWDAAAFEHEIGAPPSLGGVPPVTLAHNCATTEGVDQVLAAARSAGADPVLDAQARDWGGYSGYFADPDGFRWEIAYNPGPLGRSVLP
jgi:hypothetical protein